MQPPGQSLAGNIAAARVCIPRRPCVFTIKRWSARHVAFLWFRACNVNMAPISADTQSVAGLPACSWRMSSESPCVSPTAVSGGFFPRCRTFLWKSAAKITSFFFPRPPAVAAAQHSRQTKLLQTVAVASEAESRSVPQSLKTLYKAAAANSVNASL